MAGDGFSVDLEALQNVPKLLKEIIDEVSAHPARDLDCAPSAFGHSGLASATSGFSERLQRGVEALTKDAGEVAKRLDETGGVYRECDAQARNLLERVVDPCLGSDGQNA